MGVDTRREPLRNHTQQRLAPLPNGAELWKAALCFKKESGLRKRGWRREGDTCLWVDVVLWLRGGRRVAEGVCVDRRARDGMLSGSRLKLRQTGVVPGGGLIQVTAETHDKSEHNCVWRRCDLMGGKTQTCSTCTTRCARTSALTEPNVTARATVARWQQCELTGHVRSWMKLAKTTPVAKLVGTFSVCVQLISQSPDVICPVLCFLYSSKSGLQEQNYTQVVKNVKRLIYFLTLIKQKWKIFCSVLQHWAFFFFLRFLDSRSHVNQQKIISCNHKPDNWKDVLVK